MTKLPLEIQTLYAELLERLVAAQAERTIGDVRGTFVTKTVKGETYCLATSGRRWPREPDRLTWARRRAAAGSAFHAAVARDDWAQPRIEQR